jgi:hypothetical protein
MKHRFVVYQLNHTILCIDLTEIGLPSEIYAPQGKSQTVPSVRFQSWKYAETYLLDKGASEDALARTKAQIEETQLGVLTIL